MHSLVKHPQLELEQILDSSLLNKRTSPLGKQLSESGSTFSWKY